MTGRGPRCLEPGLVFWTVIMVIMMGRVVIMVGIVIIKVIMVMVVVIVVMMVIMVGMVVVVVTIMVIMVVIVVMMVMMNDGERAALPGAAPARSLSDGHHLPISQLSGAAEHS